MKKLVRLKIAIYMQAPEDAVKDGRLEAAVNDAEERLNKVGKVWGAIEVGVGDTGVELFGSKAVRR